VLNSPYIAVAYISTVAEIKRGRRPGTSTTRDAILAAARERFSAQGFDRVRMRDVASDAGFDVALVTYHFGSKDGLFGAALEMPEPMAALMADVLEHGELDDFGERFLRRVLEVWDDERTGGALVALVRSAMSHPPAAERLREFVQTELLRRIADRLDVPDADRRAALFGSQLIGLMLYRHVLQVEPVASMSRDELVERAAPALQRHLTGS
jgi:AcrR family transcriptional regulator